MCNASVCLCESVCCVSPPHLPSLCVFQAGEFLTVGQRGCAKQRCLNHASHALLTLHSHVHERLPHSFPFLLYYLLLHMCERLPHSFPVLLTFTAALHTCMRPALLSLAYTAHCIHTRMRGSLTPFLFCFLALIAEASTEQSGQSGQGTGTHTQRTGAL